MRTSASAELDLVFIEGLVVQTIIGIDTSEQDKPQPVRLDITLGQAPCAAGVSDRIVDTIDYGEVLRRVQDVAAGNRFKLLERLAEEIVAVAFEEFGAQWVRVRAAKPFKFPSVEAVGVEIERTPPAIPSSTGSLDFHHAAVRPEIGM